MAYSKSKFQLTHLLQDVWYRMGQFTTWKVTGGSATTVVNTNWAGVEEQIFDDDDPALIYGSAVVVEDAAGAGAAPEGEIGSITDYDSSTYTITMDTLSSSVASGDRVGIASPQFPYQDMRELANIAIRKLGKIDNIDTSITTSAGRTEYTMPIQVAPKRVRMQTVLGSTNNNKWEVVQGWSVIPAAPGTGWTLVIPNMVQGYKLELLYEDLHPELTAYDSNISELIAPELLTSAVIAEAFQWYNNKINGSNAYFLQRENKAIQDLAEAKVNYPINRIDEQVAGLPHWGLSGRYVPKTSDLRY